MSFQRKAAEKWQEDIPGARWFKADLHIHTIDDHAGGRAMIPAGLSKNHPQPEILADYARRFLRALARRDIRVAGLTPHSPRVGDDPETSAVWRVVEEWNEGYDDDGVPFREKVYALFPGFEVSFRDGREGLHILFLFDPEIGREHYLKAFEIAMGGIAPWQDRQLKISNKRAEEAFRELRGWRERECPLEEDGRAWNHLVLAPHIDSPKGLLGSQKAQVLQLFAHGEIAGLELGDDKLPDQALGRRPWLSEGMQEHRQAFFHSSDAYDLEEIGRRYSWIKLASPRIEALRQAFIARDSRLRIGFERAPDDGLREISDPPVADAIARPWLREAKIEGGASFFGGGESARFRLSPDLTCIIGGSMTGKSTFLDGLRVHIGAGLPDDGAVREQVEARGRLFTAGAARIELDCPGSDSTAPSHRCWPARFFTQNELQRLTQDGAVVEEILAKLVSSETESIEKRTRDLDGLDRRLSEIANELESSDGRVAEAEQALQRAENAAAELTKFAAAGLGRLHRAGREHQAWKNERSVADDLRSAIEATLARLTDTPHEPAANVDSVDIDVDGRRKRIARYLEDAISEADGWISDARKIVAASAKRESDLRRQVEGTLGGQGIGAARLREFQELERQASLSTSYRGVLEESRRARAHHKELFEKARNDRRNLQIEHRRAFERLARWIERKFDGQIRVRRVDSGRTESLERFLASLRQRGVTRWWNELPEDRKPSPESLGDNLESDTLGDVGMTDAVQETFRESMTRFQRWKLAALRCPDRYVLECRIDGGGHRSLDELSGGRRVGVLLSLLLEIADNRPLVIDQPEDELDNRFLFDTMLPVLKRLRGRRQVILATHNANIVVNGDADMVIQLEATADRGRVACAGAIEEPAVRDAIVRTVDGGEEAFRLRRRKYGF